VYPLAGLALALGAPLGLVMVRALEAGTWSGPGWLADEVRRDPVGYLYLSIATSLVFVSLGRALGAKEDRMRALMLSDPLTGLSNRRHLEGRVNDELARASRYGGDLSLLVIDVDHLKEINDRRGHGAGDGAIVAVATAIRDSLRATDVAARHGGDELAVLCPCTRAVEAAALAERIRARLRTVAAATPVTVSIGIAELGHCRERRIEDLFSAADAALYAAKLAGRDQVRIGGAGGAAPPLLAVPPAAQEVAS
jgi:diguanylate cyclase (GGDEF)-like protein